MRADVAPGEITRSSFHHCLPFFLSTHTHTHPYTDSHTHSSKTFFTVQPSRGESLRRDLFPNFPSGEQWLPPTFTYGFIYFLQGFKFASLKLLPAAGSTPEVKHYKIKYRAGKIPLLQHKSLVHVLSTIPCLTFTEIYILHLQSLLFLPYSSVPPPLPWGHIVNSQGYCPKHRVCICPAVKAGKHGVG